MPPTTDITTQIKDTADIVQIIGERVDLKKSGSNYIGLCPFHGEKTPSFSVNPSRQFFHCFGCGESGDVINFTMKSQGLDFKEALHSLAARYGINIPERPQSRREQEKRARVKALYDTTKFAAEIFEHYLYKGNGSTTARKYLKNRKIDANISRKFKLGCAPHQNLEGWNFLEKYLSPTQKEYAIEVGLLVQKERGGTYNRFRDRILFPIFNISGQICGFSGRILGDGNPKYLNSPESDIYNKSNLLLGLYQAKESIHKIDRAIIVEGNFDMLSLYSAGCENVVAPLGTALTREQLRLLKRYSDNATLLFDGDTAGIKAARRAVPLFLAEQVAGKVALLPAGHDPDSFVRHKGLAALIKILENAKELPEFTLEQLTLEHGSSLDGKMRIVTGLKPMLDAVVNDSQRSIFISHFAHKLGLTAEELARQFESIDTSTQNSTYTPIAHTNSSDLSSNYKSSSPEYLINTSDIPSEMVKPPDDLRSIAEKDNEPYSGEDLLQMPPNEELPTLALSKKQRQIIDFMILNPEHFDDLIKAGLREIIKGTAGENILLAMQEMLSENSEAEPEALLAKIPAGTEREFVAELLINPPLQESTDEFETESSSVDTMLSVMLQCIQEERSSSSQPTLLEQIAAAEKNNDMKLLHKLLKEQQELSLYMQKIREENCGIRD